MKRLLFLIFSFSTLCWAGLPPTGSEVSGDSSNVTTFNFQFPNFAGTHTGTTVSLGTLSVPGGGTGQTSASSAINALLPTQTGNSGKFLTTNGSASSWGSGNSGTVTSVTFTGDGTVLSSTPSSAVTTSGTVTAVLATQTANKILAGPSSGSSSSPSFRSAVYADISPAVKTPTIQSFFSTGSTTGYVFTITTSTTCSAGDTYTNNGNTYTVLSLLASNTGQVFFASGAGAPAASGNLIRATGAGTATVAFTSSTAMGSYTTPSPAPIYLRVRMTGGGGGGAGSGTATGTAATAGTSSFFLTSGTSPLITTGGGLGSFSGAAGAGGTASRASAIGLNLSGAAGSGAGFSGVNTGIFSGAPGGGTIFGGAGAAGGTSTAGGAAALNTGSGGGGAGCNTSVTGNDFGGSGGGASGFVDVLITSPAATYYYTIGVGGNGGTAGTNGNAGGNGATGLLEVTEYYQ